MVEFWGESFEMSTHKNYGDFELVSEFVFTIAAHDVLQVELLESNGVVRVQFRDK